MFAALYADGRLVDSDGDTESVGLELDTGRALWCCRACGAELAETTSAYTTDTTDTTGGPVCWAYEPAEDTGTGPGFGEGPHDPQRVPLSWCNHAGIQVDPGSDSVTVSVSVGDPRGAFTLTLSRVPDDAAGELAGRVVLHVPYPGQPLGHLPLAEVRPGSYAVGHPPAPVARPSVPAAA